MVACLAVLTSGCPGQPSCGWDPALDVGATYDVELIERYSPDSTAAHYSTQVDLEPPLPSCGDVDEVDAGTRFAVQTIQGPGGSLPCSLWIGDIVSPSITFLSRFSRILYNVGDSALFVSGRRDLGGGCTGAWELTTHAPVETDPFRAQRASELPVIVVYRVFVADPDAEDACTALTGVTTFTGGQLFCGDAFVARMTTR